MVFRFISPNVKCAAIRIYKNGLMDLPDILDCLDMSESTFFCALRLYWETGNIERPRSTTCSRPRKVHFDNLTYMIALINHRPDWFLDELLGLLDTNRFISVHFTTIYCELKCSGCPLKSWDGLQRNVMRICIVILLGQWVNTALRRLAFLMSFQKMSGHSIGIVVIPKRGNTQ